MIDLHSHVLPGLDDGPVDYEGSLALLRAAEADGTQTLAATPHVRHDFPRVRVTEIHRLCDELNGRLPEGSAITVVPGGEVDLLWAQAASPPELRAASYLQGGTDILLETPYGGLTAAFEELVFRVTLQGFRVLLAHPETNPTFQTDSDRLAALVRRGVLIQVTARSLARGRGRSRAGGLALALVEEGLAHVIASDAHSGGNWRPPELSAGVEAAARVAGERAEWMVSDAPAAILAGDPLPAPPGARTRPRRRLLKGRRPLGSRG